MRRSFALIGVTVLVLSLAQVFAAGTASAATCPSSPHHDWVSSAWNTTSARGVRAPVQLRKTGTVCTVSGSQEQDQDSDWIAIEPGNAQKIVQAGFVHLHNYSLGVNQYCRFWANGGGAVHAYKCGSDSGGKYVYFVVRLVNAYYGYYYKILDCGTSGYGSCTTKNASQPSFSSPWGLVSAETSYGGTACTDRIMGSPSLPANIGTSAHAIQWQTKVGGSWGTKSLNSSNGVCSHYKAGFSNTIVSTWDNRN